MKYQVRSKELIDVINEIKSKRLIISPYFQRELVWRLVHKIDFIKTILLGFPFPQIFIAKGNINLELMSTTSCIVDGQQRMNAIKEFLVNDYKVEGKFFQDFSPQEKEAFLKYQIPIIDLDLDNDDPQIIEIFQRLNRTFYALSNIEKLSTQYAASEYMLVSKLLSKDNSEINYVDDFDSDTNPTQLPLQKNPFVTSEFINWANTKKLRYYPKFLNSENIFTTYELNRQVDLSFTLNAITTLLSDFYNRNDLIVQNLELYSNDFPERNSVIEILEESAHKFLKIKLSKKSYWLNKANAFSLLVFIAKNLDRLKSIDEKNMKIKLEGFEKSIPIDYALAAREAVNNKAQRLIRNKFLEELFF